MCHLPSLAPLLFARPFLSSPSLLCVVGQCEVPELHASSPVTQPSPAWGHSDFSHRGTLKANKGEELAQAPEQKGGDKIQAVCLQSSGLRLNCFLVCGLQRALCPPEGRAQGVRPSWQITQQSAWP